MFVFFLGFAFGGTSFLVVFLGAMFFFALIFGGSVFLGFFLGGIIFLGFDFSSVSNVVLISAGSVMAELVIVGEFVVVVTTDVVGISVGPRTCVAASSSTSGTGRGIGGGVTL